MINRIFVSVAVALTSAVAATSAQQNPYVGRWNITPVGDSPTGVYWLEVKQDGGKLSGMLLNRGGHPLPLPVIKIENGELIFQPDGGQRGPGPEFHLRAQGDKLNGSVKLGERTVELAGARPPKWGNYDANAPHKFGKPVELFDAKSMDAWDVQNNTRPMKWGIEDGAMTNQPPGAN